MELINIVILISLPTLPIDMEFHSLLTESMLSETHMDRMKAEGKEIGVIFGKN
jgi:hypothetical protein